MTLAPADREKSIRNVMVVKTTRNPEFVEGQEMLFS